MTPTNENKCAKMLVAVKRDVLYVLETANANFISKLIAYLAQSKSCLCWGGNYNDILGLRTQSERFYCKLIHALTAQKLCKKG